VNQNAWRRSSHAAVVSILGLVTGAAGAIAATAMADLGSNWYPIAVALTGFPCIWLGGMIHRARHSKRESVSCSRRCRSLLNRKIATRF
jgi:hypothetical protein